MTTEFSPSEHEKALCLGTDVPEQEPSFKIELTEVGVSNKTVWIRMPQCRIPFDAQVYVDLPGHVRGIHMSRIEEAISSFHHREFPDPGSYARRLAVKVMERQRGTSARVVLRGKIPLVRKGSISGRESMDTASVGVEVKTGRTGAREILVEELLGLGLCHITACPCTQLYTQALVFEENSSLPLPTHSQRSVTWLWVGNPEGSIGFDDLYDCLKDALHATQDLLKRPDEAELVLRAHRLPQFAEDSVREVAYHVGLKFRGRLGRDVPIRINSLSLESIHLHDVRAEIRTTMGRILDALA